MECKQRAEDDMDTVNKPNGRDRSSGRRGGARDWFAPWPSALMHAWWRRAFECDDDGESDDGTNPIGQP